MALVATVRFLPWEMMFLAISISTARSSASSYSSFARVFTIFLGGFCVRLHPLLFNKSLEFVYKIQYSCISGPKSTAGGTSLATLSLSAGALIEGSRM